MNDKEALVLRKCEITAALSTIVRAKMEAMCALLSKRYTLIYYSPIGKSGPNVQCTHLHDLFSKYVLLF